jgi:asparagine synthase (glutamine-hydrolysing)
MSGIVGVWTLDGTPRDASVLAPMSAALRHRGADGTACCRIGSVDFACQQMWVTREEIGEVQPLTGRGGGVMLMMDGRLDNRRELLAALDLPATVSDAACALAAYEAWSDGFAAHLNGEFAIAIYDNAQRRLLLARDAIGIRPLYYFRNDRLIAFASEIKALLAHPDIPAKPDDEGLADFMLTSSRPIDRQEITCFAGISALVPAHLATATPNRFETTRYWDFDCGHALRLRSFDDYADAFKAHFAEAVRRRLRSARPVAISVSGGLDSSSIFCQARQVSRAGLADAVPRGLSYVGARGSEADEDEYLLEIERAYEVAIERFSIEPLVGLVEGGPEQIRANETPLIDYSWQVSRQQHALAAAGGSRVLLTGHWGDQVLVSSAYLVDLFDRLSWPMIRHHLHEYSRWYGDSEGRSLSRRFLVDVARHHLPRAVVPPLKWIRRRVFGVERPKPWFSDAFLRRALRFANRPATTGSGFHSAQARALYLEARSKYHVHCIEWHNKIAAQFGLDASFPMMDRDLLAFLMSIPGEMQNHGGVPRAILREAMRGVLPERIRVRSSKGNFSGVVNRGVAKDVSAICRALSEESCGVQLGYFDGSRLRPSLAALSTGLMRPDCLDAWDLADLFGLEMWLRVFSTDQRSHDGREERHAVSAPASNKEAPLSCASAHHLRDTDGAHQRQGGQ